MEIYKTSLDVDSERGVLTVNNIDLAKMLGNGEWDFVQIHNEIKNTTDHRLKLFLTEVMKSLGSYYDAFDWLNGEEVMMYYGEEYALETYDIPKEEREGYMRELSAISAEADWEMPEQATDHTIQVHDIYDVADYIDCDLRIREVNWTPAIVRYIYDHIDDLAANAKEELLTIKKTVIEAGYQGSFEEDIDYSNENLDYFSGVRLRGWRNLHAIFSELSEYKKGL